MESGIGAELERILPVLKRWASRYAVQQYDIDDLVTDTIIDLLEHPDKYKPERGSLRSFLFSAIKNRACDFLRCYNRVYKRKFRRGLKIRARALFEDTLRSERVHVDIDEAKKTVQSELEKMSKFSSTIFRMYAVDGKSCQEIATALGTTYGNVKSIIHRAKVRLRSCLSA